MFSEYVCTVTPDVYREIRKRGNTTKKLPNGTKTKKIKSSAVGWGPVSDTIPVVRKDVQEVARNLELYLKQLVNVVTKQPITDSQGKTPFIISSWLDECNKFYDMGSIGLVPDCFQATGVPPNFRETPAGQAVFHFARFVSRKFN